MRTKRLPIRELQPTDLPTDRTMAFYDSLGEGFYDLDKIPQVWKTNKGYFISDGNNQIFMSAYKGKKDVEVDFNDLDNLDPAYKGFFEEAIEEMQEGAQALRELGVANVYDLFDSFNFQKAA
tara:strand:- start:502 stop:867 length:366 start_codon:yes stop_codon:yes gene_type:complete